MQQVPHFPQSRILVVIFQVTTVIPISHRKLEGEFLLISIHGNRFIFKSSLIERTLFKKSNGINIFSIDYQSSCYDFSWTKKLINDNLRSMFSLSAPVRAPGLVTAHNTSSTSLIIKWSHLLRTDFRGEPVGYGISYNSVSSLLSNNYVSVKYTTNTTILTNLTAYTMYVIDVSAVSSGGVGPANTVKAQTEAEGDVVFHQ